MDAGGWIAIGIIALIIGGAVFYIIKAKKSGKKCIGCPDGCCPSAKGGKCNGSCCSCGKDDTQTEEK